MPCGDPKMNVCKSGKNPNLTTMPPETNEIELLERLRNNDDRALDAIFYQYYDMLVNTAWRIVGEEFAAKDIAQDVLAEIWIKRQQINIHSTLGGYLRRAVGNRSIDYLEKHKKMVFTGDEDARSGLLDEEMPVFSDETRLLEEKLQKAIEQLPEKCRIVFVMNRFETLSYKQIANELQISIKTVEAQVSKALRILRKVAETHRSLHLLLGFFWFKSFF